VDFAYYRRGERASILGVQVQSVLDGRVAAVILNRIPYGNMVIVETSSSALPAEAIGQLDLPAGRSLYLLYAHMNAAPLVALDDRVACGQVLGEVGNTPKGWSSDPHLHLEARAGPPGVSFAGMVFYDTGATQEEMDNYRRWRMSGEFQLLDPLTLLEYGLSGPGSR
jgi:murein DD-endopeptidase MepM/ murein hydrolase activator NlpD